MKLPEGISDADLKLHEKHGYRLSCLGVLVRVCRTNEGVADSRSKSNYQIDISSPESYPQLRKKPKRARRMEWKDELEIHALIECSIVAACLKMSCSQTLIINGQGDKIIRRKLKWLD